MKYERINRNSNSQQAARRGVWVLYSPYNNISTRNGKPLPFRYSPDRPTVRAEVLADYRRMKKAIAKKNKEDREAAQDNQVQVEGGEGSSGLAGPTRDTVGV